MALVDVNQQSPEKITPDKPQHEGQTEDEKAIVKMVTRMIQRSKVATDEEREIWLENYRFTIDGRQWPIKRPSWRFSEVVNLTLAAVLQEQGIQTDSRPKTEYIPTEPSDFAFAETLKLINDINWSKPSNLGFGWIQKTTDCLMDCKLADFGAAEVVWDPELSMGIGDIGYNLLDPIYCYWDPQAVDMSTTRWFVYAEPKPTSELRMKYPDKKEVIKPDMDVIDIGDKNNPLTLSSFGDTDKYRLRGLLGRGTGRLYQNQEPWGGEEMTMFIRAWMTDETVVEETLAEPDADGNKFIQKKKFPKGRYIEMASNRILADRENGVVINGDVHPYEDGLIPVAILKNYSLPRKFVGLNEITNLRGPQTIYNYTWSNILDQMKIQGNPWIKVQKGAVDDPENLTNEPGLIVEANDINGVQREPGTPITSGMFNLLEIARGSHDLVQGLSEASKGTPQPNVTSGLQLEGFVEAAQTRPRLKNRNLDDFLQQIGHLMLSRYLQFYKQPRVFRVTNKEGFPEFVTFSIGADEKGQRVANVSRQVQRDDKMIDAGSQQQTIKGMPDVKVQAGSALPFAKAQKTATALDLFSRQAIDQEALLDAIDWPNKEEVIQRMQEQAQAAAEAEAQAAPAGA